MKKRCEIHGWPCTHEGGVYVPVDFSRRPKNFLGSGRHRLAVYVAKSRLNHPSGKSMFIVEGVVLKTTSKENKAGDPFGFVCVVDAPIGVPVSQSILGQTLARQIVNCIPAAAPALDRALGPSGGPDLEIKFDQIPIIVAECEDIKIAGRDCLLHKFLKDTE